MKYVARSYSPEHFHTRKDCPYFPDTYRLYKESDERLNLRQCDECSLLEFEEALAQG